MRPTVQRLRLIGITGLLVLLLAIVGSTFLSPAYSTSYHVFTTSATMTLNISPNPAPPNQPVTFSGQVSSLYNPSGDAIDVNVFTAGSTCTAIIGNIRFIPLAVNLGPSAFVTQFGGTTNPSGSFTIVATGGLPAGSYLVNAQDGSWPDLSVLSSCDPLTVGPPIPEYPYGMAFLAIFMILAYGVIRRKTRYDYTKTVGP